MSKLYIVVWESLIVAESAQDAAQKVRAWMIEPGNTFNTFQVKEQTEEDGPWGQPVPVCIQDPDRSNE